MFGRAYVRRISEVKVVGKKSWGDSYTHTNYKLIFGWFKFGESWTICQTFLLPSIPAIQYIIVSAMCCMLEKFQRRKILQFYQLRHYVRKPFTVYSMPLEICNEIPYGNTFVVIMKLRKQRNFSH